MYEYQAEVLRVIDGDTVIMRIDHGFEPILSVRRLRMNGIDAPERNTEAGKNAALWLSDRLPAGGVFRIKTHKPDKYGRWLVDVFTTGTGGETTLNQLMIDLGLAKPYDGGKR